MERLSTTNVARKSQHGKNREIPRESLCQVYISHPPNISWAQSVSQAIRKHQRQSMTARPTGRQRAWTNQRNHATPRTPPIAPPRSTHTAIGRRAQDTGGQGRRGEDGFFHSSVNGGQSQACQGPTPWRKQGRHDRSGALRGRAKPPLAGLGMPPVAWL